MAKTLFFQKIEKQVDETDIFNLNTIAVLFFFFHRITLLMPKANYLNKAEKGNQLYTVGR